VRYAPSVRNVCLKSRDFIDVDVLHRIQSSRDVNFDGVQPVQVMELSNSADSISRGNRQGYVWDSYEVHLVRRSFN
jgi:hypothetical protein